MSDRVPVRSSLTVRGGRFTREHVSHLAFFVIVASALLQFVRLNSELCWYIAAVSGLLALTYTGGVMLWDRLGAVGRAAWIPVLLALWGLLLFVVPAALVSAFVWCALPLACAAQRVLGRRSATAALALITLLLVTALVGVDGRFVIDTVLVPVVAVWGTVALYRAQQRDAEARRRLVEELRDTRDLVARQQRRAGVLAERTRIARDLHDTLAQELAGGLMLLQAAERDWEHRPDVARTRVRAVADGLSTNLTETRRMIKDLTPSTVAETGLEGALRVLCARSEADGTAARIRFQAVGDPQPVLDEHAATTLFRVAQSTLANVREHAHAVNVRVTLSRRPDHVDLEVSDDGVGFDPAEAFARTAPRPGRGFGLPAARARLREFGGDLDISGVPGRGTRVRATVSARPRPQPTAAPAASVPAATAG
ncbi:sensor histidine kinase [Streptomyces europaeiscabiei]|uniref:sensor histidine kinase n=1 Tax=Streptomyces europaeiscabiei TaxID=146819 RepID=UPI0029B926A8|nr:sensor histidine kinase [Streptomyces europaeiscabiei]MDX3697618.1 sensor histidine kinase [Streptomyces europaeiscabiei]